MFFKRFSSQPATKPLAFLAVAISVFVAACSKAPPPDIVNHYANRFGPTESASFGKCPELNGVWNLGAPSGGTIMDPDDKWLRGSVIPHFRWVGPTLFGLTPGLKGVIAASPRFGTTLFFSDVAYTEANPMPQTARRSVSYSELSETDFPCIGAGWRQGPKRDHSSNDAAARVLNLDPDKTVSISQIDYMALTTSGELLIGTNIRYQGSNQKGEAVNDAYWHFLKLPRLAADAQAAGYSNK